MFCSFWPCSRKNKPCLFRETSASLPSPRPLFFLLKPSQEVSPKLKESVISVSNRGGWFFFNIKLWIYNEQKQLFRALRKKKKKSPSNLSKRARLMDCHIMGKESIRKGVKAALQNWFGIRVYPKAPRQEHYCLQYFPLSSVLIWKPCLAQSPGT